MPCFQKIVEKEKNKEKVPKKCPYCGNRVVENHCFACAGKPTVSKKEEAMIYV